MKKVIQRNPRFGGWTVFEVLCFAAAYFIVFYFGDMLILHFHNEHRSLIIYLSIFIIAPLLGIIFCILLHKFARHRHILAIKKDQIGKKNISNPN